MAEFQMKPFFPPEIEAQWLRFAALLRQHLNQTGQQDRYADHLALVETFCQAMKDPGKRERVNDYFYGIWRVTTDDLGIDQGDALMEPFYRVTDWFEHR